MLRAYLYRYTKKNASRWLVLFIDVFLVGQLFFLAYLIRFNFSYDFDTIQVFTELPFILLAALLSFLISGSYKGVIRHTGVTDALYVFIGLSIQFSLVALLVLFNRNYHLSNVLMIPLSTLVIHFMLNIIVLIASRFLYKFYYRTLILSVKSPSPILIYGAGEMGVTAYTTLQKGARELYKIIGFVDDDPKKAGKLIDRKQIYDPSVLNNTFVEEYNIKEVVIAIQKIAPKRLLELVDDLKSLNLEVKIAPPVSKWVGGTLEVSQIKPIRIEDLLERSPIQLSNENVQREIDNKTILVTGAAGSIGSEISRQITLYNCTNVILVDQSESALYDLEQELKRKLILKYEVFVADIRDLEVIENLFHKFQPDYVFHAAAYKHVPLMELAPYQAVNTNIKGTKNLVDLSLKYNVEKFVMVSTDKAVNPTNVMGASKRIAEMYVTAISKLNSGKTKFITTRFGNVLGSNGSVIPLFKKQIENGGPLTLTHREITRYFMTIPEACQLVIEAGCMGNGGEIFIFDMGKSVRIYDLAVRMIQLSGLKYPEDIDIEITGLRPGEKLYEELLNDSETTLPTHHEKIMIGKVRPINAEELLSQVNELCLLNKVNNAIDTVVKMKTIVPEFQSQNSTYVSLDKKS